MEVPLGETGSTGLEGRMMSSVLDMLSLRETEITKDCLRSNWIYGHVPAVI